MACDRLDAGDITADNPHARRILKLDDQLLALKKEQFNLRFQRASGQLENTSRVRAVRRDIARIKTIARQKAAGAQTTKA